MERSWIDDLSDSLKQQAYAAHIRRSAIESEEPAAWCCNTSAGVQFWLGGNYPKVSEETKWSPLYKTPARDGQRPVAWKANGLIAQDGYQRELYRDDLDWCPLYTAR